MVEWRKILVAVVAALVATAVVQADLATVSQVETDHAEVDCVTSQDDVLPVDALASLGMSSAVHLDLGSTADPLDADSEQAHAPTTTLTLADRSDSVDLCLYALMGLGLCRSGHWIKKSSLGFVPEWYHHGGPFQIGDSHAVGPDCLCSTLACFVQPETTLEDSELEHHQGTIAPLLRKSLFTPSVLASRGPPHLTCEQFAA